MTDELYSSSRKIDHDAIAVPGTVLFDKNGTVGNYAWCSEALGTRTSYP